MKQPDRPTKSITDRLRERIETLEVRLRHMQNDFYITREENENSTRRYMEILANLENLVAERTSDLERTARFLEQKSTELQIMLDSTPSLFMFLDRQGRFVRVNQAFAQVMQMPLADIVGNTVEQLMPGQNPEYATRNRRVIDTGEEILQREEIFYTPSRRLRLLMDRKPYRELDGSLIGVVCFALDVTEMRQVEGRRRELEKQLRQTQKMEAIGTLAGGIAHDFNNILSIIMGYADLVYDSDETMKAARGHAAEIIRAGTRARDLVRQILTFSRQGEQESRPLVVAHVVKEVLRMIRASLPSTIELKQNVNSKGVVLADPTRIHQLVMNLCTNAWQSMRGTHGRLTVTLQDVASQHAPEDVTSTIPAAMLLHLQVTDMGHGIPPEIHERIFEPYFTTRDKGEGTGIGLSIVHGIVTDCGGQITFETEADKGTTFHVWLPIVDERSAQKQEDTPRRTANCTPATVLFVDDEPQIAELHTEGLERLGYTIESRTGSREALELFRQQPQRYDVVVTDLTMPQMNGLELAAAIRAIRPDVPVILCTGYSEQLDKQMTREHHIDGVLLKPLVNAQLVAEMERCLHREEVHKND